MDNPNLNLKTLNEIEYRINNMLENELDYELLDRFILFVFKREGYIKNLMKEIGFNSYDEFIFERKKNKSTSIIKVSRIEGSLNAILSNLKSFAIKNKFY